jgi:ATP dependent DNA ligase-like protein
MSASRELQRQLKRFEPCLPRAAKQPPAGPGWIHEIKHDGYRIIAERDHGRVRLYTRNGCDFADRFPLAAAAIRKLPVRSCLIDGEAIVCDDNGLAVFDLLTRSVGWPLVVSVTGGAPDPRDEPAPLPFGRSPTREPQRAGKAPGRAPAASIFPKPLPEGREGDARREHAAQEVRPLRSPQLISEGLLQPC